MAEIAADRSRFRRHRDRGQAHPREGAQIGDEHLVVGMAAGLRAEIEGIGVLHQKFARAHDAETRAHLVAEFPLDMEQVKRQVLVGAHIGADDLGDHLLIGRAIEHLTVVPVDDAQHFLAIGVIAPRFAPQISGLDRRHQHFDRAGADLLLADDGVDLVEHAQPQRQPGVNAGGLLANEPGPQHQPMRDDLRLLGRFAQNGEEIAGEAHVSFVQ